MGGKLLTVPIYKAAGFSLCSGTALHLTAPNDLTNASWQKSNVTVTVNNQTDPFGVINNAGSVTCNNAGGGAFSVSIAQTVGILTANTTYEISGYFKSTVAPVWMRVSIGDSGNAFDGWAAWVNCSTAAMGTTSSGSGPIGGTFDCGKAQLLGTGWVQFTLAGHYTSNSSGSTSFFAQLSDTGSTSNPTLNQAFNYYTLGP